MQEEEGPLQAPDLEDKGPSGLADPGSDLVLVCVLVQEDFLGSSGLHKDNLIVVVLEKEICLSEENPPSVAALQEEDLV